jgi:hypothetical protein
MDSSFTQHNVVIGMFDQCAIPIGCEWTPHYRFVGRVSLRGIIGLQQVQFKQIVDGCPTT